MSVVNAELKAEAIRLRVEDRRSLSEIDYHWLGAKFSQRVVKTLSFD
jgi:hypothetical protein